MNASGVIFYSTFRARSFLRQLKTIIDFIFGDQCVHLRIFFFLRIKL